MDNLARNAMLAKEAGLSYGRWKAMQEPVPITKPEGAENEKQCPGCGKYFTKRNKKQIYCEPYCQKLTYNRNNRQKRREYMRERRAQNGKG